jgi:glycosyltransferase involved in cell wall biosynthesis
MRVLHVYSEVIDSTVYGDLASGLNDRGFELGHCMLTPETGPLGCRMDALGQTVWPNGDSPSKLAMMRAIQRAARAHRADLTVAFGQTANLLLGGLSLASRLGPTIGTRFHSDYHMYGHRLKGRLYDRITALAHDAIIVPSESAREWMTRRESVRPERVRVVPFGLSLNEFASVTPERVAEIRMRYNVGSTNKIVLASSRPVASKGLTYLVEAIARIQDAEGKNGPHLIISNWRGAVAPDLAAALVKLDPSRVSLVAREEDYAALLRAADVFVHVPVSPYAEGFGQVYFEALAAQRSCVFTLSGGLLDRPDLAGEFVAVPYRDSEAIEIAVAQILSNPVPVDGMVRSLDAKSLGDAEAMSRGYASVYRSLNG